LGFGEEGSEFCLTGGAVVVVFFTCTVDEEGTALTFTLFDLTTLETTGSSFGFCGFSGSLEVIVEPVLVTEPPAPVPALLLPFWPLVDGTTSGLLSILGILRGFWGDDDTPPGGAKPFGSCLALAARARFILCWLQRFAQTLLCAPSLLAPYSLILYQVLSLQYYRDINTQRSLYFRIVLSFSGSCRCNAQQSNAIMSQAANVTSSMDLLNVRCRSPYSIYGDGQSLVAALLLCTG
jgi:hypothetical protein